LTQDRLIHGNSDKAKFSQASTMRLTRYLEEADMLRLKVAYYADIESNGAGLRHGHTQIRHLHPQTEHLFNEGLIAR
jgi:hypothetical protein